MKFETELGYIKNERIRDLANRIVSIIPEYFYKIPASSSGKYHPNYALGDGGLYRHVVSAVTIAQMLFRIVEFEPDEEDLILVSLIAHDGWKQGVDPNGHTKHAHPVIASEMIEELIVPRDEQEKEWIKTICSNIASHMGQWNTNPYNKNDVVLPLPKTKSEKFVHTCDYLASRKQLEFNFEVPVQK